MNTIANAELQRFVDSEHAGNQTHAADALEINRTHLWRMLTGKRRVTPDMADRIETITKGRFKRDQLVWPNRKKGRKQ